MVQVTRHWLPDPNQRSAARLPRRVGLTQCSTGHLAAAHAWPSFHSGPSAVCRKAPVNANVRPRVNVRPYSPSDWERLCLIHDQARLDELRASGLIDAFLSLEETAENEGLFGGEVLLAELHGEVCGFVAYSEGELTWLYVEPAKYKQGVGRELLRHAIRASGGSMTTEVLVGNEPALALYRSEGFELERRVDGKLTGNEAFAASGFVLRRTAMNGRDDG
jgi:ribosomal protein S18 acetylase RimI-like enzyme